MESDDLDAFIATNLEEELIEDVGFTRTVAARLFRRRLQRRGVLGGTAGLMTAYLGTAGLSYVPSSLEATTPVAFVALVILMAACSLVWIGTEPALDMN